jgi:hypothetical protein
MDAMGDSGAQDPIAESDAPRTSSGLGRRKFLATAAAAGAVAWAAPAIITMQPAGAASLTSPPPTPPPTGPTGVVPTGVEPADETNPDPNGADPKPQVAAASTGTLPFTGADIKQLAATGLAATAGGGALMFWSADRPGQVTPAPATDAGDGPTPSS